MLVNILEAAQRTPEGVEYMQPLFSLRQIEDDDGPAASDSAAMSSAESSGAVGRSASNPGVSSPMDGEHEGGGSSSRGPDSPRRDSKLLVGISPAAVGSLYGSLGTGALVSPRDSDLLAFIKFILAFPRMAGRILYQHTLEIVAHAVHEDPGRAAVFHECGVS